MSSSVDSHSIPPFYACYLLRSYATSSSARTYIGSTPDPARRKKQHNGILTQGAHKTKRGRPWETQMLIYGFPSKIAALQFEWAWQKPHMSRHLRTHPAIECSKQPSSSSQQQQQQQQQQDHIALPLFTDTPLNQIAIGKDGCKPLPCSSVQTSLLVARALLKSEPFAGWGLQIIFFEEYLWAAWNRLQTSYPSIADHTDAVKVGLYLSGDQSRLRRPLPPQDVSPDPICDFAGVDGGRKSMLTFTEDEKKAAKLENVAISKTKTMSKAKAVIEGKSPGLWPERLPRTLNVRSMGGTWQMLEIAPYPATSLVERGKKKEVQQDCITKESEQGSKFHLDDEDVAFQSFERFQRILEVRNLSIEDVLPLSVTTADKRAKEAKGKCNICRKDIDLREHTSYTLCSSPFEELQPRPKTSAKSKTKDLSLFGFGLAPSDKLQNTKQTEYRHCDSLFHTCCLAESFLKQNNQNGRFLLPTHGYCPICYANSKPSNSGRHSINTWNEVIRCTFRRRDYILREAKVIEVARMKAAKVAIQQAKKVRKTNTTKRSGNAIKKKISSSQQAKGSLRHGDSDEEREEQHESESEKENQISNPSLHSKNFSNPIRKAGSTGRGGLMDMLHQIEEEEDGGLEQISNIAALAAKRTVPSNWTPLPSRTAPSDRTNMQTLDLETLLDDEIESVSPIKAGNYANSRMANNRQSNVRTLSTNLDVIDLT